MSDDDEREPEAKAEADSGAQAESTGDNDDHGASEQDLVDRDKVDFDPDDGLYTGTAVDGTSEIPGPHSEGEDIEGDGGAAPGDKDSEDDDSGDD